MTSAPRLSRFILATAAGFALTLAAVPAAAAGYLKLGDIKGESSDSKHKNWIDVESWSWGESRSAGAASDMRMKGSKIGQNAPASAGKANVQDISITKSSDKSSPKLAEAAVKGKVFSSPAPRGSLTTFVPAGTCRVGARYPNGSLETETMRFEMENIMVTSCATGGSGGSGGMVPTEQISLNYEKVTATRLGSASQ